MDKIIRNLRKEMTNLIDNIKEHSDMLTDYDRLPEIELQVILKKIEKLFEYSIILNYLYEKQRLELKTKFDNIESKDEIKSQIEEKSWIEKMQKIPINDLTTHLSVNEKFFYAKELFNDDINALNKTLLKLNQFNNFDKAYAYIKKEILPEYKWNLNDTNVKNFVSFVKRKFI